MSSYILIPDTNPVKHVKKDITDTDCIHLFNKYNYEHTVQPFEGYLPYNQKWVSGDLIRYQIWLHNVENCSIDVVDSKGLLIQNYPINIVLPNYLIDGLAYDICQFNIDTTAFPVDKFYTIIKYKKEGATTFLNRISEPQEMVSELKPSILLRYKHSQNEYNTLYKTSYNNFFEQDFYFRVEGRVRDDKPASTRQTYEDMRMDLTLLDAKPFDVWRFFFGSGRGVPAWVGSKLNMILSHNTITVDDIAFTFIDELNKKDAGYYSRYLYECTARYSKINYVEQCFVPEPPDIEGGLILPDAYESIPYSFIQAVTGDQPFTLSTIVKPSWMTITVSGGNIIFGGTPAPGDAGTGITVSFDITNVVGTVSASDTIDVFVAAACIPVAFEVDTPAMADAVAHQPYNMFLNFAGTSPFTLSNIVKPLWATVTAVTGGISITGTPTAVATGVAFSFDISNCGGGPSNTISFAQNINVGSGISITGTTSFSLSVPNGSGNIFAAPGTLVTVEIIANGMTPAGYTINAAIVGAAVTGATTVTNGIQTFTFIMPISGSVSWSATYSAVNSSGSGSISVS